MAARPRRYFARVLAMMDQKKALLRRQAFDVRQLLWGLRSVLEQGVKSSYRGAYWAFLIEAWRRHRDRLPEILSHASAGHHFIEYTRRIVIPRLSGATEATAMRPQTVPEAGGGGC